MPTLFLADRVPVSYMLLPIRNAFIIASQSSPGFQPDSCFHKIPEFNHAIPIQVGDPRFLVLLAGVVGKLEIQGCFRTP
jgi:hypothetical protein